MAGLTLGQVGQYTPFEFQNPEQSQNLQIGWPTTYAVDIKRDKEISELKGLVAKLTEEVNRLERMINDMGVVMNSLPIRFSVVDVEDRSLSETKELLIGFYKAHRDKAIYPDDVATELGLDLKLTMQAVRELIREGKIGEVT